MFAIAITLLALPLALPRGDGVEVWGELQRLGPSFRSFCISFVVIGAYWIGHRGIFLLVERSDRRLLWLNLLLLFFIVLLPFTTSLVGEHGDQAGFEVPRAASGLFVSTCWRLRFAGQLASRLSPEADWKIGVMSSSVG